MEFRYSSKFINKCSTVVNYLIKFWGSGKVKTHKQKLYEQENLQLNINKANKYLNWHPTFNIKKSVMFTVDWYYKVLKLKEKPENQDINLCVVCALTNIQ